MPKIDKILSLEITPEQFLNSCSLNELREIDVMIEGHIRRKAIEKTETSLIELIKVAKAQAERDFLNGDDIITFATHE